MTLTVLTEAVLPQLRRLALERPEFEEFFKVFARRERNASETELNTFMLIKELAQFRDPRGRSLAIEFFRRLEGLGVGQFRVGRRKKPSRFIWSVPLTEVAAAAVGKQPTQVQSQMEVTRTDARDSDLPKLLSHTFVLREKLLVTLDLPIDLTAAEARRLSTFVQTLPFDEGKGE